jgi:hypothetical protein
MRKNILVEIISVLFILLFTYAALSKLIDYQKFRVQIGQSPLLTAFAGWVAWIIPSVELFISVMLMTRRFRTRGLYASFSLMVLFTGYIIAILKFSDYIPCSCGGILQKMSWGQHLIFNIVFIFLALTAVLVDEPARNKRLETSPGF